MTPVTLGILRLASFDPSLALPAYASAGAAGLDIRANLALADRAEGLALAVGARALVPTGLALAVPKGFEVQLRPRSGLALREGLTLLNSPGTIDSDYRGEIGLVVVNHGKRNVVIEHGMRIAQMVLAPVLRAELRELETLDATARGEDGFGSTGRGGPRC